MFAVSSKSISKRIFEVLKVLWESKWRILRESDIYLFYTKKLFVVLIVIFTIFNFSKIETNIVFQFHRRFTEV